MALAPDNTPWYRRFRMLFIVYLLGLFFGGREFLIARSGTEVDPGSEEWSRMAEVIAELNPADADTDFLLAMEALQEGDEVGYIEHMETALARASSTTTSCSPNMRITSSASRPPSRTSMSR